MVCGQLQLDARQLSQLNDAFPAKHVLSRQTDSFADSRARALDAYLQLLLVCLGRGNHRHWNHPAVVAFFRIPSAFVLEVGTTAVTAETAETAVTARTAGTEVTATTPSRPSRPSRPSHPPQSPVVKTPQREFSWHEELGRVEGLLRQLATHPASLTELNEAMGQLQLRAQRTKFGPGNEQQRYFDLKRDVELYRIRHGETDSTLRDSFRLSRRDVLGGASGASRTAHVPANAVDGELVPTHDAQRSQLRYQEAILTDLATTLRQQRELSLALADEIVAQNRLLSQLQGKEEATAGRFRDATVRVKRLQ